MGNSYTTKGTRNADWFGTTLHSIREGCILLLGRLWLSRCLPIRGSVVWSPAPLVYMHKCPWARYWTPICECVCVWVPDEQVGSTLLLVCVNVYLCCKSPFSSWKTRKAAHKHSPFIIKTRDQNSPDSETCLMNLSNKIFVSVLIGAYYNIIRVPPTKQTAEETLEGATVLCSIPSADKTKPSYYHSFGELKLSHSYQSTYLSLHLSLDFRSTVKQHYNFDRNPWLHKTKLNDTH